jgi:hypothetical protein
MGRLPLIARLAAGLERLGARVRGTHRSHRAIFGTIYRHKLWASDETASGPGSTRERAAAFRDDLIALLARLDTRVLLDAACGDFNWMAAVADTVPMYVGVDVVPGLVALTAERHGRAGRAFLCRDVTADPLPRADVILCRDCLVHFSLADGLTAVRNFARSGATYLLATTFADAERNTDIVTGGWRALNLERPPFLFPSPLAVVDERCLHSQGRYRSKRLALWALGSLERPSLP